MKKATCHPSRDNNSGGLCKACAVRGWQKHYREALLTALGGKCIRCGESDWDVLCVDHVGGGGHAESRKHRGANHFRRMHQAVVAGSTAYQALCANCNLRKARQEGEFKKTWLSDGTWVWKGDPA